MIKSCTFIIWIDWQHRDLCEESKRILIIPPFFMMSLIFVFKEKIRKHVLILLPAHTALGDTTIILWEFVPLLIDTFTIFFIVK